jgi:hypothetical protein
MSLVEFAFYVFCGVACLVYWGKPFFVFLRELIKRGGKKR